MPNTITRYEIHQTFTTASGKADFVLQDDLQTLQEAKKELLGQRLEHDNYVLWVRKVQTTDFTAADLGMIDDQS